MRTSLVIYRLAGVALVVTVVMLYGCGGSAEPFEANGDGSPIVATPAAPAASDAKDMKVGSPNCSQGACK